MSESTSRELGSVTSEFMVPSLSSLDDPRVIGLEAAIRRREAVLAATSFAATRFLGTDDWDRDIRDVLARLGSAAEVSRVHLFAASVDDVGDVRMRLRHEWVAPGITPLTSNPAHCEFELESAGLERWRGLAHGDGFDGSVASFPPSERAYFEALGFRSLAVVPVFVGSVWWGFLAFAHDLIERE
jgi:hypothetical protein